MTPIVDQWPITEAVCEFLFEEDLEWDIVAPGLIYERVKEVFPDRRPFQRFGATIQAGPEGLQHRLQSEQIARLQNNEQNTLMQVGQRFLSIHKLAPYSTWSEFLSLIDRGFGAYSHVRKPRGFRRIGLRYINRIEIPSEDNALEEHFNFRPLVEVERLKGFRAFITGIEVGLEQGRDVLKVQLSSTDSGRPELLAVMLDLDYYLAPGGVLALADWKDWIEVAHRHLREVFKESITATLRKRFESKAP
jgi:uncharacterized protein (TIGR04255 family)